MNDLFTIPVQLSPRLAWMKEHGVVTHAPGWMPGLSAQVKEWMTKHQFAASAPDGREYTDFAVIFDDGKVIGDGDTLSDAINDAVHRGATDPGVHPDEARQAWPKSNEWSAENRYYRASAATEEDAIVALAKAMGVRLWNER